MSLLPDDLDILGVNRPEAEDCAAIRLLEGKHSPRIAEIETVEERPQAVYVLGVVRDGYEQQLVCTTRNFSTRETPRNEILSNLHFISEGEVSSYRELVRR